MDQGAQRPPSVGGELGRELEESPPAHAIYDSLSQLGYHLTLTSVDRGGHVKNSDHYKHRAVDVGAVDGQAIGENEATWGFLCNAILSGAVKKVGTFKAFATNPALEELARQHGVSLFEDEGTGAHVHLAV